MAAIGFLCGATSCLGDGPRDNDPKKNPKLPDWAIVDLRTPPDSRWPGKIVADDFFTEGWQLSKAKRR